MQCLQFQRFFAVFNCPLEPDKTGYKGMREHSPEHSRLYFPRLHDAVLVGRQLRLGAGAVLVKEERLRQLREELRRADAVVDGHAAVV